MMISDLPSDLIEKILFRVPAISLGRSRLTCKRWNALVNDPIFTKNHFDKAVRQSLIVSVMDSRVYLTSFNLHRIENNVDFFIEFPCELSVLNYIRESEFNVYDIFHCDGLLLFTTKNYKQVVLNPCTGQTIWLKPIKCSEVFFDTTLGYNSYKDNKLCHNYKILRRYGSRRDQMEIYEFCSNSWRLLNDDFPPRCSTQSGSQEPRCVSLKGNTYWIALSSNEEVDDYVLIILCFNFSTERFQCLLFPTQKDHGLDSYKSLAVVREEQLSVSHWSLHTGKELEIWVSTKIETTNVSWSKLLKVGLHNIPDLTRNSYASFFIDHDKKVVIFCHWSSSFTRNLVHLIGEEEDTFREISLGEYTDLFRWGLTLTYVPSLVRF